MRKADKLNDHGFTLVELMMVISIITLLISIMLPSMAKSRRSGRTVTCLSNTRQITIAHDVFTINNSGKLLPYEGSKIFMPQLLPYHSGDKSVRFCPEADKRHPDGGGWGSATHAWGYGIYDGSYALNGFLYASSGGDAGNEGGHGYFSSPLYIWPKMWFGNRLENVQRASDTPIFADSPWVDAWPISSDPKPPNYAGRIAGVVGFQMQRVAIDRHDMTVNVAFVDNSARRVPLADLWNLSWHVGYVP